MMTKKAKLALMMAVILPLGCAREEMVPDVPSAGPVLNIDGSIAQVPTRATGSGFEGGDEIGLFAVNYSENNTVAGTLAATGNQADNAKYTYNAESYKWTTYRPVYYKDALTHADLYVYYPYQRNISDVEVYPFEVAKDQTTARSGGILGGYEASDLLWCKVTDVTPTEEKVQVRMEHRMAGAQVTLVEGTGFDVDEFASLSKSVILLNTTRKATVNFQTGTVTKVGDPQADGIVMCPQDDGSFRAVVVPQSISNVYLLAITIDGQTYRYRQGSNPIAYTAGHIKGFSVTVNKTSPSGDYEFSVVDTGITDWSEDMNIHAGEARQYYVVNVATPGTLGATITAAGKNPDRIRNLKVTGTVNTDDFYFMRDHMAILEAVNMRECKVVSGLHIEHVDYYNESLYDENVIPEAAFNQKKTLTYFVFPEQVSIIASSAFEDTSLSGALVIPEGVKTIGYRAFYNTLISSVSFPQGLLSIGVETFYQCTSLTGDLLMPDSVESLGKEAFGRTTFSGRLHLSESLTEIPDYLFYNSGHFIGDVVLPEKVTAVGDRAFAQTSISGRIILNNCVTYEPYSFYGCGSVGELVIPEGTTAIPEHCFNGNRFVSISFPESLRSISGHAFAYTELVKPVVFPEGLVSIGERAFVNCSQLPSIEFPSTLQSVGQYAFQYCFAVSSIISHATIPPTVQTGAFNGVGKDNFTVEVPEASLVTYQTENGWSDFKRYASYQNFSISRRQARALNNGKTGTYTLRCPSGMAWTVADKPDWITVSPSSGTGKTDITLTFAAMDRTNDTFVREQWNGTQYISSGEYKGRAGEVVFELTAKGNQSTMRVEQFDYDYYDGQVFAKQSHTVGDGIDIVLTGDGYDAMDIASGAFMDDMNEAVEHFFDLEPYHTYRDRFNVYYVFAESNESGIGSLNTLVDNKFGSTTGESRLVPPDTELIFSYALKSPVTAETLKDALVILIDNTSIYEGVTYMYGDGSAIACCPKSSLAYPYDFRGIVQHEAGGHGFGKLGDEYIYHNAFIGTCTCLCCDHGEVFNTMKARGWFRNLEFTGNMNDVAWSHLIFNPDYSDKVDIYEGGYMHNRGVFRSEATSCMNNNIPYYSAISRQAMVERILTLSGEGFTMQKFYDNDSFRVGAVSRFGRRSLTQDELHADFHYSDDHGPVYMGEHPILK